MVIIDNSMIVQKLDATTRDKVLGTGSCSNHILNTHILDKIICSGAINGKVKVL